MKKLSAPASAKASGERFDGHVWFDQVWPSEGSSRVRVGTVRVAPRARTAWHLHAAGQTLHLTERLGSVVSRHGEVIVMHPGDTVHTPPGQWHWHGAASDRIMSHLAIWDGTDGPGAVETTWGEHVTDDEYRRAQPQ
jgi:quercetin dioxygenase-like cupin family protein